MNSDIFISTCATCGYSTKEEAKRYTKTCRKELYSNDDFEEVFRIVQREQSLSSNPQGKRDYDGTRSTKRFDYCSEY